MLKSLEGALLIWCGLSFIAYLGWTALRVMVELAKELYRLIRR